MFTRDFDLIACPGDTITCEVEGFTITATLYRDDDTRPPNLKDLPLAACEAWYRGEWFYCGVAVTVARDRVELIGKYEFALWGVDCNLGKDNSYLRTVANGFLPQALATAKRKLDSLCCPDMASLLDRLASAVEGIEEAWEGGDLASAVRHAVEVKAQARDLLSQ